jgi:transposase InsO family protein
MRPVAGLKTSNWLLTVERLVAPPLTSQVPSGICVAAWPADKASVEGRWVRVLDNAPRRDAGAAATGASAGLAAAGDALAVHPLSSSAVNTRPPRHRQSIDTHPQPFMKLPRWILTLIAFLERLVGLFGSPARKPGWRCRAAALHPVRHARRKPAWVVRELIRLAALTSLSCRKLCALFNRLHAASRGTTVSKSFVAKVLQAHRYEIEDLRVKWKRRVPPPLPVNHTWGFDMTGKGDDAGAVRMIAGLIDHGSRRALALRPLRERTAIALLKVVIAAVETCGKPRFLRTDNEAVFRSRVFTMGLKVLGIRQRLSQPGCPWQNGRIERLFGTLKEKLDRVCVPDVDALGDALRVFKFWYNEVRSHDRLEGRTPMEAWNGIDPYRTAPKAAHRFGGWDGLLTGYYLRR